MQKVQSLKRLVGYDLIPRESGGNVFRWGLGKSRAPILRSSLPSILGLKSILPLPLDTQLHNMTGGVFIRPRCALVKTDATEISSRKLS